jgi:Flp pilus assembly protein TadG
MRPKRKRNERGQSLTEMALVLPVLLFVLAGVLDVGRLYYVTVAITDAAAEGASYAAIAPRDMAGIVQRAQSSSGGLVQIESGRVSVDCPSTAAGSTVTVTVNYSFTVATPLINAIVPEGVINLRGIATEVILTGQM